MTRCQYAQLMQQKFTPNSRSGYSLPHVNSQKFKSHDLGAKLVRNLHSTRVLGSRTARLGRIYVTEMIPLKNFIYLFFQII